MKRLKKRRVALISTGGTIEKTYDALEGVLHNEYSVLDVMLASLLLEGLDIVRVPLMNKDSLDMTPEDHTLIAETTQALSRAHDGIVIIHGTDRLAHTGDRIVEVAGTPRVPVVLTGAIRPYVLRHSDATQNFTEALLAVQILEPGVYCVIHSKVLRFPGVTKDHERGTFRYVDEMPEAGASA
ncbi:MAG: asparaginase domain-containing protein [Planctomycetota bacterium]